MHMSEFWIPVRVSEHQFQTTIVQFLNTTPLSTFRMPLFSFKLQCSVSAYHSHVSESHFQFWNAGFRKPLSISEHNCPVSDYHPDLVQLDFNRLAKQLVSAPACTNCGVSFTGGIRVGDASVKKIFFHLIRCLFPSLTGDQVPGSFKNSEPSAFQSLPEVIRFLAVAPYSVLQF